MTDTISHFGSISITPEDTLREMRPKAKPNNPDQAGARASKSVALGEHGRYRVYAVHTRFDAVQWFVKDALAPDDRGFATVIRQEPTFEASISGLSGVG